MRRSLSTLVVAPAPLEESLTASRAPATGHCGKPGIVPHRLPQRVALFILGVFLFILFVPPTLGVLSFDCSSRDLQSVFPCALGVPPVIVSCT